MKITRVMALSIAAFTLLTPLLSQTPTASTNLEAVGDSLSGVSRPDVFVGNFETGDLSQWAENQSCPNGVTIVTSPVRSGRYSAKFTVADGDTNANPNCPNVPTASPRAQLVSPDLFVNGDEYYIGFSTFFPANFPTPTDWFQFAEIYGPPFGGSPSMGFDLIGNRLSLQRDPTHNYDAPWVSSSEIKKGTGWEDIVAHVKFSTDPKVGFIEIWLNGVKQTFKDGTQKFYYDTLVPSVNWDGSSPNAVFVNQYRSPNTPLGTVTLYHDEVRVGQTYQSVQPHPPVQFSTLNAQVAVAGTTFAAGGRFTLGSKSNGINPIKQAVTLKLGGYEISIPPSYSIPPSLSFVKNDGNYTYQGTIGSVKVQAILRPLAGNVFLFGIVGRGAVGLPASYPVPLTLMIGDDAGTEQIKAGYSGRTPTEADICSTFGLNCK